MFVEIGGLRKHDAKENPPVAKIADGGSSVTCAVPAPTIRLGSNPGATLVIGSV
jgi:hypothetical protein